MKTLESLCYASLCILSASSLPAQDQWEAYLSAEKDENVSDPTWGLQIIRNNAPINFRQDLPWDETSFVDRIGFLDFSVSYLDTSEPAEVIIYERYTPITFDPGIELSNKAEYYAIGYTHRQPGSPHVFSASAGYREIKSEVINWTSWWFGGDWVLGPQENIQFSTREFETHIFNYTAGYDYYLTDEWTVGVEANLEEYSFADRYRYSLTSKGVWELGQDWISIEGAISWIETDTLYIDRFGDWLVDAKATYYFTPRTGLGAGVQFNPEGGYQYRYTLSLDHHFTKRFSAQAVVDYHDFDTLPEYETDTFDYTLRLGFRF